MKVIEKSKVWFGLSTAIIVLGLIMGMISGFNLGIDFTGGTMMQIHMGKTVPVDEVKNTIKEFELDADVIHAGMDKEEIILKTKKDLNSESRQEVFNKIKKDYNLKDEDFRQAEQFGPSIGKEIQAKAIKSILIASILMLIYISFRFELKFGVAAILTLIHDILVVLSLFAIFKIPINNSFVAAMLTIVGYSINDTIVVFDRIRENIRFLKKKNYGLLVNESISQTIVRSINTSVTTLMTITFLYILGVESIKEFALPLVLGVGVGTYSSIFVASPIWVGWKNYEVRKKGYGGR
ncbi:MAG: protein translocase subunit SecF [Anaeromicrobium sp.]|jgi:preprotein translocase SecF subunit|uniref:protein translocase subunit SecF n=1 Tax=Anaeromicrobium sp. TaxID=1929132 RepID=UPI0025F54168|nr:protein translocase subunit SecF [Anaeromicrobium sp.]MCT4595018.1 protein translocase subunit SecF [Anaeromicrobium sp.]